MKVINTSDQYIFISGPKPIRFGSRKTTIFVDETVFQFVEHYLEPQKEFLKKLFAKDRFGNCLYNEDNWHDKLTKQIVDLTNFDETEVSNSVFAIMSDD